MTFDDAQELEKRLREMADAKAPLVFFGTGDYGVHMLDWFRRRKLVLPVAFCDNSAKKQGTSLEEIPIFSFEAVLEVYPNCNVVITSYLYGDVLERQVSLHLPEHRVLNVAPYFDKVSVSKKRVYRDLETWVARRKEYQQMLLGGKEVEINLLTPEDMPKEAKEVVAELEAFYWMYAQGETMEIPVDDFYLRRDYSFWEGVPKREVDSVDLQEFLSQDSYCGVYKIEGNHILCQELYPVTVPLDLAVWNISGFSDYLKGKEIPFLYVQIPNKLSTVEVVLPKGTKDEQNPWVTTLLKKLEEKKVHTLDYRKVMMEKGISSLDVFLRTETHWNTSIALDAAQSICEKLADITGFSFDFEKLQPDAYEKSLYPSSTLGSWGRNTGILFTGLSDFELFLPKYETDYQWSNPTSGECIRGEASRSLTFPIYLDWEYFNSHPYAVNLLKHMDYTIIKNYKKEDGKKALILHDSFCYPLSRFLAPQFSQLHFMDIRGKLGKKEVLQAIERIGPEVVIMAHWPYAITGERKVSDIFYETPSNYE